MAESAEPSLLPLVALPVEAVDDLIYDARAGDRAALEADLAAWAQQLGCPVSHVVASAIDAEPQSEGGSGACLLHFPAANGNVGAWSLALLFGSVLNFFFQQTFFDFFYILCRRRRLQRL